MEPILAHVTGVESGVLAACLFLGIALGIGLAWRVRRPGAAQARRGGPEEP